MFRADKFITSTSGPLRTVKTCRICGHFVSYPKGVRGAGRGYGLAEGGRAMGAMRRHVRDEHPEALEEEENAETEVRHGKRSV